MPKNQPVTIRAIDSAKTRENPYKIADSGGLYLLVHPNGSRYWRVKYRIAGKEKTLALGVYPAVTLKEARDKRDSAKKLIQNGQDPVELKKADKRTAVIASGNTFESLAREWHEKRKGRWTENHAHRILTSLENDVFPAIGHRPIDQINTPEVLALLRKVEKRDALDVAKRLRQRCSSVFAYAKQTGRARENPVNDLEGALKTRKQVHRAALTQAELPEFQKKLAAYDGDAVTRHALAFLMLTFVRSSEVRGARWDEFDFKAKEWRIPAKRMKMREEHIVPLSKQALALLEEVRPLTGKEELVFSAKADNKPLSENTLLFALYRMGYHKRATVHGFRATASTILNESGQFAPDVIERQLAHAERNGVRAAYNRSQYLPERRKMMLWWGDYLHNSQKTSSGSVRGYSKKGKKA